MPVVVVFGGVAGRDLDYCSVVVPGPLVADPVRIRCPMPGFHQIRGVLHGEAEAGVEGDHIVGADGKDVAGAALADALAQAEAAVDPVAGQNAGPDSLIVRVLQQLPGQLRLRRERDVVRDPARSRRSSSAAQPSGRYRARRSGRARPGPRR